MSRLLVEYFGLLLCSVFNVFEKRLVLIRRRSVRVICVMMRMCCVLSFLVVVLFFCFSMLIGWVLVLY